MSRLPFANDEPHSMVSYLQYKLLGKSVDKKK
jgi:hypothetical protein